MCAILRPGWFCVFSAHGDQYCKKSRNLRVLPLRGYLCAVAWKLPKVRAVEHLCPGGKDKLSCHGTGPVHGPEGCPFGPGRRGDGKALFLRPPCPGSPPWSRSCAWLSSSAWRRARHWQIHPAPSGGRKGGKRRQKGALRLWRGDACPGAGQGRAPECFARQRARHRDLKLRRRGLHPDFGAACSSCP